MVDGSIAILIGSTDPEFLAAVQAVSPRLRVYSTADLHQAPARLAEVQIAFGAVSRAQLPEAKSLRWLQTTGAGVNQIVGPETRERGILVTNTSGIHGEALAEHLFGMLLMHVRRLGIAWDQQKERRWRGYDFANSLDEVNGKTLGLLAVGAIGTRLASVGRAFGMRVVGLRRSGARHPLVERMYRPEERLQFLGECDVVMNTLPLTEATRGFLGREELAALPKGAIVVNGGRGPTLSTEALLEALDTGHLGAALLDVTDPEPLPADHPLWTAPNVFITPHYGGGQPDYLWRSGNIFLENLRRYLAGGELLHQVDQEVGY